MQTQSVSRALSRLGRLQEMIDEARGRPGGSHITLLRLKGLVLRQQERLAALITAGSRPAASVPVRVVSGRALLRHAHS